MTKDYKEKAKFAGARILCAQASAVLASYLPTLIINYLGKDSATTFLINGAIFGCLASLVILLSVIFTWERPYSDGEKLIKPEPLNIGRALMIPVNIVRDLFSTLRIRAFRQHLSIYLGGYISQDIFNAAFAIFVAIVMLGSTLVISQLMTFMYIVQFISVMIAIRLVMKAGPTKAYTFGISAFIASCVCYYLFYVFQPAGFGASVATIEHGIFSGALAGGVSAAVLFWLFVPVALAGLGRGTLNFVPWSVYNYLPDIDEAVTGQRREGIFAGVMTLVRKLSQAIAVLVVTQIMQIGGYVKGGEAQTPEAVHTVVLLLVVGPIVIMLLGFIIALKFKLNARTHAVLIEEIDRLRAGETEPSSPESRAVVEDLTGWQYERLWGRNNMIKQPAAVPGMPPSPTN
jgi:oligogalacturonide transporter